MAPKINNFLKRIQEAKQCFSFTARRKIERKERKSLGHCNAEVPVGHAGCFLKCKNIDLALETFIRWELTFTS